MSVKKKTVMSDLHFVCNVLITIFLYFQPDVCKYFAKGGIPSGNALFPTICNQGKLKKRFFFLFGKPYNSP